MNEVERRVEELNTPPPGAMEAIGQPRGRRPKGWGDNDDAAESSSLRTLAALQRR